MLRGLLLFTATAHGGGREATSGEGEQAQAAVEGDGSTISCDGSTIRITVSWIRVWGLWRATTSNNSCVGVKITAIRIATDSSYILRWDRKNKS